MHSDQKQSCDCHECTQARYCGSLQGQLTQSVVTPPSAEPEKCRNVFKLRHGLICELKKGHKGAHEAQCPNPQFWQSWADEFGEDAAHSTPPAPATTHKPGCSVMYETRCDCGEAPAVAPTPQPGNFYNLDASWRERLVEELVCKWNLVRGPHVQDLLREAIDRTAEKLAGGAVAETPRHDNFQRGYLEPEDDAPQPKKHIWLHEGTATAHPDTPLAAPQPSDERAAQLEWIGKEIEHLAKNLYNAYYPSNPHDIEMLASIRASLERKP